MKTNQWQSKIGGAILAISFVFGIAVLRVRAQAQNPDDRYSQDRNRSDNGDENQLLPSTPSRKKLKKKKKKRRR